MHTIDRAVYAVDRAVYTVDRAVYTVDRAVYAVDRAVYTPLYPVYRHSAAAQPSLADLSGQITTRQISGEAQQIN